MSTRDERQQLPGPAGGGNIVRRPDSDITAFQATMSSANGQVVTAATLASVDWATDGRR
ncbi:MAG: hypothetical protein ABSE67_10085 [Xanthobacteraceae bacterium]